MTEGHQRQAAVVPGQGPADEGGQASPAPRRRRSANGGAAAARTPRAGTATLPAPGEDGPAGSRPAVTARTGQAPAGQAADTARTGQAPGDTAPASAPAVPPRAAPPHAKPAGSAAGPGEGPAGPELPGPPPLQADGDVFGRYTRDYVGDRPGQQIAILHAGCTTAAHDLGAARLRMEGADIVVTLIDDGCAAARDAVAARPRLAGAALGDLRAVPLPPRSQDIVHCPLLLHRISHAELVLDRLVAAMRPGGLLMLRLRDRESAVGFLDRIAPGPLRRLVWRSIHPGRPGPYPAIYERLNSVRGLQSYASLRGLVFAERHALGGTAGGRGRRRGRLLLGKLIASLSRGRLTAAHDELVYVLRKPENRFARLL